MIGFDHAKRGLTLISNFPIIKVMKKLFLLVFVLLFTNFVNAVETPVRDAMKARREVRKEAFEVRKDELASKAALMRESYKVRREAFKENLKELKDEKKQVIVERIDKKIDELNQKHTARLAKALERMSDILGRLEDKVASASSEGKSTASASAAVTAAQTAITAAQSAVSDQSAKDYTPTITDETTLGQVLSKVFSTFSSDMKVVHGLVKDAKDAVKKVATEVRSLKVENKTTDGSKAE